MPHTIISLDGNIGAGKSTLLAEIKRQIQDVAGKKVIVVDEPVAQWTSLKNENGENLLELFYKDKRRWAYTFQSCAILTRLKCIQNAVESLTDKEPCIIITERSILTDKYVFAEMLRESGDINQLEWELYENMFQTFSKKYEVNGIIYVSTSSTTSKDRIVIRNRLGEDQINLEYLKALDAQHKKWVNGTDLPVLSLSTEIEVSVDKNIKWIRHFLGMF
jgi:deoxyadenosine/deoxycytidine kinase